MLLKGVVWTLGLTAISAVIGVALGVACAWARVHGATWLRWVAGGVCGADPQHALHRAAVLHLLRPACRGRSKLSPETASIIAMVINLGAYAAEIIRAGIEATPRGQIEAALSLALTARRPSCAWCCRRRSRRCGRRWSARSSS
jgi:polar amino acid transport system permease protein